VGEIAVEIPQREQGVFEHRRRNESHPGDGVVNRQLRGVEQVPDDDLVFGLFEDFEADQTLGGFADAAALIVGNPAAFQDDDVEPADVHCRHRPDQFRAR